MGRRSKYSDEVFTSMKRSNSLVGNENDKPGSSSFFSSLLLLLPLRFRDSMIDRNSKGRNVSSVPNTKKIQLGQGSHRQNIRGIVHHQLQHQLADGVKTMQ